MHLKLFCKEKSKHSAESWVQRLLFLFFILHIPPEMPTITERTHKIKGILSTRIVLIWFDCCLQQTSIIRVFFACHIILIFTAELRCLGYVAVLSLI